MLSELKKKLRKIFEIRCPYCNGIMDDIGLDIQINKLVYKCRDCGKEWV